MALQHTPSLPWPMPRSTRRHPKPDRRRALELLASRPDGYTEAIMLAHGFSTEMLVRLVRDGLASAKAEHMVAGGQRLEIARVKITAAEGTRGGGSSDRAYPQARVGLPLLRRVERRRLRRARRWRRGLFRR
jgi:hypothetical protein